MLGPLLIGALSGGVVGGAWIASGGNVIAGLALHSVSGSVLTLAIGFVSFVISERRVVEDVQVA